MLYITGEHICMRYAGTEVVLFLLDFNHLRAEKQGMSSIAGSTSRAVL